MYYQTIDIYFLDQHVGMTIKLNTPDTNFLILALKSTTIIGSYLSNLVNGKHLTYLDYFLHMS